MAPPCAATLDLAAAEAVHGQPELTLLRQGGGVADEPAARGEVDQLVAHYLPRLGLEAAEEEPLAHMRFPREHWPKIRSTNPHERVNLEIARRSDVVGIYPTTPPCCASPPACS